MENSEHRLIHQITSPDQLKNLSITQLEQLAQEMRSFLIESISQTGGHFASNLGMIELTIAMHYVFNSPQDKIIFDVGHQCYAHKILTGRMDRFHTLRQKGGLAGFPRREESVHDIASAGHASVSISVGLGVLTGEKLQHRDDNKVVCVIGDGSIGGGVAFEALNHGGQLQKNLIIILNDNEMSIDKNVGALHNYLSNTTAAKPYQQVRRGIERFFKFLPFGLGKGLYNFGVRCKRALKGLFFHQTLFSDLGFEYAGPINGHNLKTLISVLQNAAAIERPIVIHVVTQKGKGYHHAEHRPGPYHGVPAFNLQHGIKSGSTHTYTGAFGRAMLEAAQHDERVVAITAAMGEGTGLKPFAERFPDRYFDVGIAEAHAVAFGGGLAISGLKPVMAIYSTFMQRAVDQLIHDLSLQNVCAVIAMDRAGLVPADGETHQGLYDIAMFKGIPGINFVAPATEAELNLMLKWALRQKKPTLMRYAKTSLPPEELGCEEKIVTGKGSFIRKEKGRSILIINVGSILEQVLEAANMLESKNRPVDVYNLRFIAPIDEEYLLSVTKNYRLVVLVEEGIKIGGIGESVGAVYQQSRQTGSFLHLAAPRQIYTHATRDELLKQAGLHAGNIVRAVMKANSEVTVRERAQELKNRNFSL